MDPILAEGTMDSVACIESHAQAFTGAVNSLSEADNQLVSNRFKMLFEAVEPNEKSRVKILAAKFEIVIEKDEPPTDSDQNQGEPSPNDES